MVSKFNCILLVDDDDTTNFVNRMIINQSDCAHHIEIASNGQEAVDFLQSQPNGAFPQPELIFLDINMPIMDGWGFLEQYNQLNPEQKGQVVITMLTVSLHEGDQEKAEKQPMINEFMHKPLTKEKLQDIIQYYFPEKTRH